MLGMTPDIMLVLAILAITSILFVFGSIRVDVVAVLVIVLLGVTNILPHEKLFSGFSSEAVISLIGIMILGAGLDKVGLSQRIARFLLKFMGSNRRIILLAVMTASALTASFMRSIGTAAVFLPIINRIHNRTKIDRSYLLMPMAFCSILGGMLTMVGTGPLIVLNSVLINNPAPGLDPFKILDIFPIGLVLSCCGVIYFMIFRSNEKFSIKPKTTSSSTKTHFRKSYNKYSELFELKVKDTSELIGLTVQKVESLLPPEMSLIAVYQDGEEFFPPLRKTIILSGAIVAVMSSKDLIKEFAKGNKLTLFEQLDIFQETLHSMRSGFCEAVVPPNSQFVGTDIRELHMKRNFSIHVLALRRGNNVYSGEELLDLVLRSGDTLGMYSNWEALSKFEKHPDFFVLTNTYPTEKIYSSKFKLALFFFMLSIGLVLSGKVTISVGLLVGAIGMISTGILTIDDAYKNVSWKTIFLIAGLMPLGVAIEYSGTADWVTNSLSGVLSATPFIAQVEFALFSCLLALVISNVGATVVMVPFAIDYAASIGADPRLFALTVALAASNTFMLPTHQVNALVLGPGNYSKKEFFLTGSGMTIIYFIAMFLSLHYIF